MRPPVPSGTVFVKDHVDVWNKELAIGNAELAARLGSRMTFDRRGTIFAYDDFENSPLKWDTSFSAAGSGHSVTLSNEYPYHGSGCMKIVPPSVADDFSRAYRVFGGVAKNMVGMEMSVTYRTSVNMNICYIMRVNTGSRLITAGIMLQQQGAGGLSYYTSGNPELAASYTQFNTDFLLSTKTPYPLKFVVDIENEKYVRCMFGGTEIDMSSYTPLASAAGDMQKVQSDVYVVTVSAAAVYFDDYILTIEEPA